MWKYNYTDELYHHGILGMKWGVRRYQNKDGSLTAAGRKRQAKKENKLAKKRAKAQEKEKELTEKKPKSVKDMSDDELRNNINRLQMEKQYLDLNAQVSSLQPQHVSAGKKFVQGVGKTLVPALQKAGSNLAQQYIEKKGKELLGLSVTDSVSALKKEAETLNYKKQINEAKKYFERENKKNSNAKQSKTASDSKPSDPASNKDRTTNNNDYNGFNKSSTNKKSNTTKSKVYTGTVEGVGASKGSQSQKSQSWRDGPIYDAVYTEVTSSDSSVRSSIQIGQRYIAGLLEDKYR